MTVICPLMNMQVDAEQSQPPEKNRQNGRSNRFEQPKVQVAARPRDYDPNDEVNEDNQADRPSEHVRRSDPSIAGVRLTESPPENARQTRRKGGITPVQAGRPKPVSGRGTGKPSAAARPPAR